MTFYSFFLLLIQLIIIVVIYLFLASVSQAILWRTSTVEITTAMVLSIVLY